MIAAVCGIIALGFLSERTAIGKRLSGAVVVLLIAAFLANVGVLPKAAPVYDQIWAIFVPLAIALYLLRADLLGIVREGGRVLIAFAAGAIGVVIGAFIGAAAFDLGPEEAKLAAVFTATYSGGSLNFAGVADAVGLRQPSLLAAAVAVDNALGIGFFLLLSFLAGWPAFQNVTPWRRAELSGEDESLAARALTDDSITVNGIVVSLAIAALMCAAGGWLASMAGVAVYRVLFITVLTLAAATIFSAQMKRLGEATALATIFMYAFFIMLGAGADVSAMLAAPPALAPFVLVIFAAHALLTLAAARAFRLNYGEVIVASGACIGGPPIAIAYAVLFGWRRLAGPAIATGVLGYALGNFIGIGVFEALAR